ncbi:MAG: Crp/Fnr family transcriptional regulator [Dehalococcoidia bacterium]
MMPIEPRFLSENPYFSGLGLTELDSIKHLFSEERAERGEIILLEGEPTDRLFFVAMGVVKLFRVSAEGKEQTLELVRPGGAINEVPVFDGGPNPASAQAMGPVSLYIISKTDLESILRDYPRVALNVVKVLASQIRHLVSLVEDLSFRHVIGRVSKILLEHAGDGTRLGQRLTQQEMAAIAGTAREVVGRSLKTLEERGIIKLEHHRIVVTDKEALKQITNAQY